MTRPRAFGSFGRPDDREAPDPDETPAAIPVLHVGEVHAELRLTVTADTLSDLGSQIASMIAAATRQGFEHGMAQAMDELATPEEREDPDDGDDDPELFEVLAGSAPIPGMSDTDLARARGQSA